MNLFRPIAPGASDLPWTGMVFGITVSGVWYWCTDQVSLINIITRNDLTSFILNITGTTSNVKNNFYNIS